LLLDRGADPEARNAEGQTPLDLARKNGQGEVAALLGQFGAAAD
jgi:ankyrin repeat protein